MLLFNTRSIQTGSVMIVVLGWKEYRTKQSITLGSFLLRNISWFFSPIFESRKYRQNFSFPVLILIWEILVTLALGYRFDERIALELPLNFPDLPLSHTFSSDPFLQSAKPSHTWCWLMHLFWCMHWTLVTSHAFSIHTDGFFSTHGLINRESRAPPSAEFCKQRHSALVGFDTARKENVEGSIDIQGNCVF